MHRDSLPPTSRPKRSEPCLGCLNCFAFRDCGGIYDEGVLDCLAYCCGKPDKCSYACPKNSRFVQIVRDTGGLSLRREWQVSQSGSRILPEYVPCIQHGSRRHKPLEVPVVVLPTFEVTPRRKTSGEMFTSSEELRSAFKVGGRTRIVLSCIDEDDSLENFWRVKSVRLLAQRLSALRVEHIIAPNFSLPLEIPRFDNIANIKRSLLCAEELCGAGISVIPYVAGVTAQDWDFWAGFLREHQEIAMVAKEFQTGGANITVAEWHIDQLLRLQDRIHRALHVVAVGGRRHLRRLSEFVSVTLMNSDPFMKTYHRQILTSSGHWESRPTLPDEPLDELLSINVQRYSRLVRHEFARCRTSSLATVVQPVVSSPSTSQMEFTFGASGNGRVNTEQQVLL